MSGKTYFNYLLKYNLIHINRITILQYVSVFVIFYDILKDKEHLLL